MSEPRERCAQCLRTFNAEMHNAEIRARAPLELELAEAQRELARLTRLLAEARGERVDDSDAE